MADNDVTLLNNTSSKTIYLRGVNNWSVRKAQPPIAIPFISGPPDETFLFRFVGQREDITFNFVIFDDDVDVSNGTSGIGDIKTVSVQIAYLREHIFTSLFDDYWTITQGRYYILGADCVITGLTINSQAGQPSFATGTISLTVGSLGAL